MGAVDSEQIARGRTARESTVGDTRAGTRVMMRDSAVQADGVTRTLELAWSAFGTRGRTDCAPGSNKGVR